MTFYRPKSNWDIKFGHELKNPEKTHRAERAELRHLHHGLGCSDRWDTGRWKRFTSGALDVDRTDERFWPLRLGAFRRHGPSDRHPHGCSVVWKVKVHGVHHVLGDPERSGCATSVGSEWHACDDEREISQVHMNE